MTVAMALRLDWTEKQHPEIFSSEPSNWEAARAQAAEAAQEEEEESVQVAK